MAGTRWVRLDVEYFGNPKAGAAGLHGRALHLASICWSAAHLTDGHIPTERIGRLCADAGVRKTVAVPALIAAGLWIETGDGWQIHDYTAMQDSRAIVELRRKQKAERMARWRAERDM